MGGRLTPYLIREGDERDGHVSSVNTSDSFRNVSRCDDVRQKEIDRPQLIVSMLGDDSSITITGSPATNNNRLFVPVTYAGKNKAR